MLAILPVTLKAAQSSTVFTGDRLDILGGVNTDRACGNDFDDHWQIDQLPGTVMKRLLETMGRVTWGNETNVVAPLKDERAAAKYRYVDGDSFSV